MNRFIVVQTGARRSYAVPSILQNLGLLEACYTDMCANVGLTAVIDRFCPEYLKVGKFNQLLNRRVPSSLESKVCTFDWTTLRYLVRRKLAGANSLKQYHALVTFNQEFGEAMSRKGLKQATHIFSMFGEGSSFLEFAKQQNIKVVTEIYISPLAHQIVQEERKLFPDLEPLTSPQIIQADYARFSKVCQSTDIFIVPSSFVRVGLEKFNIEREKQYIIPYAVGDSWLTLENHPTKGRILFVGTAELRKGIHTLGMAANKLKHLNYEFRVAGNASDLVRKYELTKQLRFLGRIPRTNIQQEYVHADIFVLPTLAEGSAEVIYEALAVGLPVITTEAAGSVVRDGIEGFIVPERDAEALANRIEELVENRELRGRMAIAAKEKAKDYTWEKYEGRLLEVLQAV